MTAALAAAKEAVLPQGEPRRTLCEALDRLGVTQQLRVKGTSQLVGDFGFALHWTFALRYPVLAGGAVYDGRHPPPERDPFLAERVERRLGPELEAVGDALVVPLGELATRAVRTLIDRGTLEPQRCLLGLPWDDRAGVPAAALAERLGELAPQVEQWRRWVQRRTFFSSDGAEWSDIG